MYVAISSDIDTLESIYQGRGCKRAGGYTYAEFDEGLERFARFLEPFRAKATLFVVGRDLQRPASRAIVRDLDAAGYEVANHTQTHAQGFRFLSTADQESEVAAMEEQCASLLGKRPVGFRSPGWNIGDAGAMLLKRRGYLYDSSVFPTVLAPLLKVLHWQAGWSRPAADRTTLGQRGYMWAPRLPYTSRRDALGRRGKDGIIELPVTVTPHLRIPVFATWLLATGLTHFRNCLRSVRAVDGWMQFQFHLSDFVDYQRDEYSGQVPDDAAGVYVPRALRMPLAQKVELFRRAMDLMAEAARFETLRDTATRVHTLHHGGEWEAQRG
jgi:peptidoglycan/xylan/chitin deacetylase (PgdA/CDA1 family)